MIDSTCYITSHGIQIPDKNGVFIEQITFRKFICKYQVDY